MDIIWHVLVSPPFEQLECRKDLRCLNLRPMPDNTFLKDVFAGVCYAMIFELCFMMKPPMPYVNYQ